MMRKSKQGDVPSSLIFSDVPNIPFVLLTCRHDRMQATQIRMTTMASATAELRRDARTTVVDTI